MLLDLRFYIVMLALLSGITGGLCYSKLPNNKAKSILFFIWFSFINDFVGLNFTKWTGIANYPVYNLYILISFSYYFFLLKCLFIKNENKKIAAIVLLLFVLIYVLNYIFVQTNVTRVFTYSFLIGAVLLLIISVIYLLELLNLEKIIVFKKSIYFWFILGILVFHITYLPYILAVSFFLIHDNEFIYNVVLFVLNLLMQISFTIGFIYSKKEYNY